MQPLRPAPHTAFTLLCSVQQWQQQAAQLLATACAPSLAARGCVGRAGPELGRGGGVAAAPAQLPPAEAARLRQVLEQVRAAIPQHAPQQQQMMMMPLALQLIVAH